MSFPQYPTPDDVEALLKSASFWPTDSNKADFARLQAQIGAAAARDEWETVTGWSPFLAASTATTRTFETTDHTGYLDLSGGALSIQSVQLGPTSLTLGSHFTPQPSNAPQQQKPFTGLRFLNRTYPHTPPHQISVTGQWGYCASVPGDAWQAVLQKAALIVLTQIENLQSIASISQDGFSKAYDVVGIVTQKDLATGIWNKDFAKIAARYKRVIC